MSLKKEISKPISCDKLYLRRESSGMSLGLGCDCGFVAVEWMRIKYRVRMYDVRH
jgi:precorrin-6B methylase 2